MTDPTSVSTGPTSSNLILRPIRGAIDAQAMCAVHLGCQARDQIDPLSTLENLPSQDDMAARLSNAAAVGRADDWIVAQVDERVIGFCRIASSWHEADGTWVYLSLGKVLPDWRNRGVGTTMLDLIERRIRRLAAEQHPDETCEFAANASSTEKEAAALVLNEGYRAAYTLWEMELDIETPLPTTTLPVGIEARPVLPEHYPLIAASVLESYQNEYPGGRYTEDLDPVGFAAELQGAAYDPTLWQVAWEGREIVGQVLTAIERGRAEVFEVSVRPAWRRGGIARALLLRAVCILHLRGANVIRLHTNADFPTRARDLYQSVGFRLLKEFPRFRKPFESQDTKW